MPKIKSNQVTRVNNNAEFTGSASNIGSLGLNATFFVGQFFQRWTLVRRCILVDKNGWKTRESNKVRQVIKGAERAPTTPRRQVIFACLSVRASQ